MIDRLAHEAACGREFVVIESTVAIARDAAPNRAQTRERRDVERDAVLLNDREELVEIAPID